MYRKNQIPKSQLPKKTKYIEHYIHTISKTERKWEEPYIQVVSIDPAYKNFAIRIEQWSYSGYVTPIFYNRINMAKSEAEDASEDDYNEAFDNIIKVFKEIDNHLKSTHIFVIEKQLPQNYKVVRISQHVITYFMCLTYNSKLLPSIFEIDPRLKGDVLGAGKLSEPDLKKWAVIKATEILTARNDLVSLEALKIKKNDDLADTVVQVVAFFTYVSTLGGTEDAFLLEKIRSLNRKEVKVKLVPTSQATIVSSVCLGIPTNFGIPTNLLPQVGIPENIKITV